MSGAYLQYNSTVLSDSPSNVTLTVGKNARVYCVQVTGPVPTSMRWYNSQGQLVSRDGRDPVNQGVIGGGKAAYLHFQSYQQSQGGKYECRVSVPGNISEKLPVCIGEFYTLGDCGLLRIYLYLLHCHRQFKCMRQIYRFDRFWLIDESDCLWLMCMHLICMICWWMAG